MTNASNKLCIIGAGPAGLAMARACHIQGIAYDQFDDNKDVGGLWDIEKEGSPMYESAHFISSKTMSGFDGFDMPASYPGYPSHRQILEYIRAFADQWKLRDQISFKTRVTDIEKQADQSWKVSFGDGRSESYFGVVCATGSNWNPRMPEFKGTFDGDIRHSSTYRNGDEFERKRVLVVGAGNSGVDIACDAAARADKAFLSVRRGYHFLPKHIWGKPADVFASESPKLPLPVRRFIFGKLLRMYTGDLSRIGLPKPDHKLFETHPILNTQVLHYIQHGDLSPKADVDRLDGKLVHFVDGTTEEIDTIICATGYNQFLPFTRDYFDYEGERPVLYLQVFSREHKNLFAPSVIETNSSSFKLFGIIAAAIAQHVRDQLDGTTRAEEFAGLIHSDTPDLTGGIKFVSSDRHASYFDSETWQAYVSKLFKRMGWTLPKDDTAIMSDEGRQDVLTRQKSPAASG